MSLPAHIPDSPPPAAGPGEACLDVLTHGDDAGEYLEMRNHAFRRTVQREK